MQLAFQPNTHSGTGFNAGSAIGSSLQVVPLQEVRQMLGLNSRTLESGLSAIGVSPSASGLSQREIERLLDHFTLQPDFWL